MAILKHLTIAVTGTLPQEISQLKKWIEANGGRYSPHIRKGVTHVITGKDAWKEATDAVQAARHIKAFVVSYDWLEDSLQKRRKLAEKCYTWEYLWERRKKEREMKKLGYRLDVKKFNEGCEEAKRATGTGTSKKSRPRSVVRKRKTSKSCLIGDMVQPFVSAADDLKRRREEREAAKAHKAQEGAAKKAETASTTCATSTAPSQALSSTPDADSPQSPSSATSHTLSTTAFQPVSPVPGVQAKKSSLKDLYHYYVDTTGFEYKIMLTRCNMRANKITRYRVSILESHAKPNVYCTFVEYFPPGVGTAVSAEAAESAIIQAVLDFNKTFHEGFDQAEDTPHDSSDDEGLQASAANTFLPLPQQSIHNHPQAAHLRSLLAPSIPSPDKPYKSLIAPMGSAFSTAWRTFRHAFRDLTLLSWEERFDVTRVLYKTRACHFNIEPFVYVRPKDGLPLGLRVQQTGLFMNQTLPCKDKEGNIITTLQKEKGKVTLSENDDNYAYNSFNLPALSHPLGSGIICTAVQHDIDAARKAADTARKAAEEAGEARMRRLGLAKKVEKKPNYYKPLFNGVTGRPTTDAWGRYKRGEGPSSGSGLAGGGVLKMKRTSKPWPYETGTL
ncbi:hypothetical protein SLS59_005295 [Nothophoma quercina]|uniref:BRCT domain-containing protein n=1 Tax=Nothophoma quercina TaxID=749835 RepID=A0ABR3RA55_9PLEO